MGALEGLNLAGIIIAVVVVAIVILCVIYYNFYQRRKEEKAQSVGQGILRSIEMTYLLISCYFANTLCFFLY